MQQRCDPNIGEHYRSRAQIARVVSEDWGARNLFCASCQSDTLTRAATNTRAFDFSCPECQERYQLKSVSRWSDKRVNDSAFSTMIDAIRTDRIPNLLLLHYQPDWTIARLLLIPSFFFNASIIEKRRPLTHTAERHGWVGCNIAIGLIPDEGKIPIIQDGSCQPATAVRKAFAKVSGLRELAPNVRGWTLDVLRCVRRLPTRFSLADIYHFEKELSELHPENRHIRDKIRQQLQVLRDIGLVRFVSPGNYRT